MGFCVSLAMPELWKTVIPRHKQKQVAFCFNSLLWVLIRGSGQQILGVCKGSGAAAAAKMLCCGSCSHASLQLTNTCTCSLWYPEIVRTFKSLARVVRLKCTSKLLLLQLRVQILSQGEVRDAQSQFLQDWNLIDLRAGWHLSVPTWELHSLKAVIQGGLGNLGFNAIAMESSGRGGVWLLLCCYCKALEGKVVSLRCDGVIIS